MNCGRKEINITLDENKRRKAQRIESIRGGEGGRGVAEAIPRT